MKMGERNLRVVYATAAVAATLCLAMILVLVLSAPPSTLEIDADLKELQIEIAAAEADSAIYGSGLLQAMVEARLQVLKTNVSFLQAKRSAVLRRVDLNYVVDGVSRSADPERIAQIEADIADTSEQASASRVEADRYSGGLVQALAWAEVATHELTLSQLRLSLMAERHGFLLRLQTDDGQSNGAEPVGQTIVTDDGDAL